MTLKSHVLLQLGSESHPEIRSSSAVGRTDHSYLEHALQTCSHWARLQPSWSSCSARKARRHSFRGSYVVVVPVHHINHDDTLSIDHTRRQRIHHRSSHAHLIQPSLHSRHSRLHSLRARVPRPQRSFNSSRLSEAALPPLAHHEARRELDASLVLVSPLRNLPPSLLERKAHDVPPDTMAARSDRCRCRRNPAKLTFYILGKQHRHLRIRHHHPLRPRISLR